MCGDWNGFSSPFASNLYIYAFELQPGDNVFASKNP